MFMLLIKIYFYKMGEKFLESMRKEGYKVSKCKSRSMFITIVVINSFGMLIFSFVQIFNFLNDMNKWVNCETSVGIAVLSYIISYCYSFGPFFTSIFIMLILSFVSKVEDHEETEFDEGEESVNS